MGGGGREIGREFNDQRTVLYLQLYVYSAVLSQIECFAVEFHLAGCQPLGQFAHQFACVGIWKQTLSLAHGGFPYQ
ncbi:MAG: hypothetical protein C4523_01715 [Myxococcales bacterium]|nr:MAG: hypothetical protein C4523_01715 [Myxococcales bacterium]